MAFMRWSWQCPQRTSLVVVSIGFLQSQQRRSLERALPERNPLPVKGDMLLIPVMLSSLSVCVAGVTGRSCLGR
jgi:hypothetical protein